MSNRAKSKRDKVLKGNKKFEFRWEWLIPIFILIAGIAFVVWPRSEEGGLRLGSASGAYKRVKAKDGVVSIPVSTLDDYRARYYVYKFPEKSVKFFVLKSSDGVIRAAFDSCDVCFRERKGYRQEGDLMICNNCGQAFPSVRINIEKGGCNPAPLERSTVGSNVVLNVSEIYRGRGYF